MQRTEVFGEPRDARTRDALGQEPRRHPLGGAAQVAARKEQHALVGGARERREQPAVVVVDPGRPQGEGAVSGAAVGVGEQRVVVHAGGEESLRQPADEHPIEVEPEAQRHVTHEQPVAEATDPAEVGVELQLERAPEHVDPR